MMAETLASCAEMPPTPAVIVRHVGDVAGSAYHDDPRATVDLSWVFDNPARFGKAVPGDAVARINEIMREGFAARVEASRNVLKVATAVAAFCWGAPPTTVRHWSGGRRAGATVTLTVSSELPFFGESDDSHDA